MSRGSREKHTEKQKQRAARSVGRPAGSYVRTTGR
jgi:hypothetical protein